MEYEYKFQILKSEPKVAPGRVVDDAFVSWFPQERVILFGFQSRYNGSDSRGEGKGRIRTWGGGADSFKRAATEAFLCFISNVVSLVLDSIIGGSP